MKLVVKTPLNAAKVTAARWDLTRLDRIADTRRAVIYKAEAAQGLVALKQYKELGSSGEGAGIAFLRDLGPSIGPKIHRLSRFRTAVLMDWLDGPTLDDVARTGKEASAMSHLAQIAGAVVQTDFKWRFKYARTVPKLRKKLKRRLARDMDTETAVELRRVAALQDHLIASTTKEHVIHGDLHGSNIILTSNGPRLIDPKGMRADPAYEFRKVLAPSMAQTPIEDFLSEIANRATVMASEIGAEPRRVIQWGAVSFSGGLNRRDMTHEQAQQTRSYLKAFLDLSDV